MKRTYRNSLGKQNIFSTNVLKNSSFIKTIALSLFLSLNCLFTEENSANAQSIQIINGSTLSQEGEWTIDEAWDYVLSFEDMINLPEPEYNIGEMQRRMMNYPLVNKFLNEPLPIDASAVVQEIVKNNIAEIGSPKLGFLRDDVIYLITMSRVEHELIDLANLADNTFQQNKKFTEDILVNNKDILPQIKELEKIEVSIKEYAKINDSARASQTLQNLKEREAALEKEIMIEIVKRNGYQSKLVDTMCDINKRSCDLLGVIAELQERLKSPVYKTKYTLEEQALVEQEYKSTQDLYMRLNILYSKTFHRGRMIADQIGGDVEKVITRADIIAK